MENWKQSFVEKLNRVQSRWVTQFDQAVDASVVPAFQELVGFLHDSGFAGRMPLKEPGRRSFKFELAEDAYVLLIFRSTMLGEFEVSSESFVPSGETSSSKSVERLSGLTMAWAERQFQTALDGFVELLGSASVPGAVKEPAFVAN